MDVYSLTRKKRPSHLTLAQPASQQTIDASPSSPVIHSSNSSLFLDSSSLTDPLTRNHWKVRKRKREKKTNTLLAHKTYDSISLLCSFKPDADASHCDYLGCSTTFGLFERRHHCRKCGDIFCAQHCSNYFRLDSDAQFDVRGQLARGCDGCAKDYREWRLKATKQAKEEMTKRRKSNSEGQVNGLRKKGIMTQQPQAMEGIMELGRDGTLNHVKIIIMWL
ncbi:MAG: hypothetical protein EXX96DRAFT_34869 [Benjaminiella poitrasii]|nr:MAG: hypothetical protein EXX96DRAFT_34869 [Benjaminiella poitrasii]